MPGEIRAFRSCPGGCGYAIGPSVLVCGTDWKRVPMDLRKALWRARKQDDPGERMVAARDIIEWVHANPAPVKDHASNTKK